MGVLPDHEIELRCAPQFLGAGVPHHTPLIQPYRPEQLAPSSYDVTLHPVIKVPLPSAVPIDLRKVINQRTGEHDLTELGWTLRPGGFVLGSTFERVAIPDDLVCRIEGKSSLARPGLQIHSAGYIDPGYRGTVTLEITNFGPDNIRLWPGVLIGQLSFEFLSSRCRTPYAGRYQGSDGAVESRYNIERLD